LWLSDRSAGYRSGLAINLDKEIDRLYGLPAAEFVPARKALAKRLREEGERAAAMRVEDLRKPTVAAAAVNKLARAQRMNVRALLTAGERLRQAQVTLLEGGAPDAVHKAAADERKAIAALLAAAREDGESDAVLSKVKETLRAAAVDDEARQLLERGRLTRELVPVGFGLEGMPKPKKRPRKRPARPDPREKRRRQELDRARQRLEAAQKHAADAARELETLEEQVRGLERSDK
jgi:hypothetical protein